MLIANMETLHMLALTQLPIWVLKCGDWGITNVTTETRFRYGSLHQRSKREFKNRHTYKLVAEIQVNILVNKNFPN